MTDSGEIVPEVAGTRLIVSIAARAVLFALLGMLMWAVLPLAIGWQTTTVMTGSMEPRISAGDVIISRPVPPGAAGLGHVLLVDDPDHAGRLRLHRYVDNAPDGALILRGDANPANDSSPVSPAAVHGVAVLRVPYVGLPVVWLAEKNWTALGSVAAGALLLTVAAAAGSGAFPDDRPAPKASGSSDKVGGPRNDATPTLPVSAGLAAEPHDGPPDGGPSHRAAAPTACVPCWSWRPCRS
ncbi:hypothetical protein ACRQ5B_09165 [Pseudarthrobacter sp. L19]|uniref:hypothetical protein n=1 Tax=Pseudarthrobacter sp. L19 TaxID=3423951 RepID=UPI003D7B7AFB